VNRVVLDRQSAIPLYYQIQQALLEQIRSGALKVGQPVPSEQELSQRMGVSRMTARQALKSLCHLGVAYSQRGKGTFVSRAKLEKDFRQVLSFSEEMRVRGSHPRSRVLAFKRITPSSDVADALRLSPNEQAFFLKRIRFADSVPLCIESTHIPVRFCPDLHNKFNPQDSLYEALFSNYGIQIEAADEVAEAAVASADEAKLLRIRKKAPVFHFTRTAYLADGKPVEFVSSTYRGDRCKVVSRLTRSGKSAVGKPPQG
jgi:GntR family transcriptional regulator, N-acetylglucosamine utilization regulator